MPYLRAFGYPFRGENLPLMLLGVGLFLAPPALAALLPGILGGLALALHALQLFLVLYYFLFFHQMLQASMNGEDRFPAWPDDADWRSIAGDVFTLLGPYVVSFFPLILLRCAYADFGEAGAGLFGYTSLILSGPLPGGGYEIPQAPAWFVPASWVLAALGLAYLPMALLVSTFYGGNSILRPIAVFRSAAQTGRTYALLVILLGGLLFSALGLGKLLALLPANLFRSLFVGTLWFYAISVGMRLVGLHYHRHREDLAWEPARRSIEVIPASQDSSARPGG